ncbi:MAG TPA: hypothetical protein VNE67_09015 [Acetobacteraceae bacterium]|nr:hypothetical protein [Acetobacteraceae bacterium]
MKLKTVAIDAPGAPEGRLDYADLIEGIVGQAQDNQRLNIAEVRRAVIVLDALARARGNAGAEVLLEEADWGYLKVRVEAHRWPIAHRAIVRFVEDIAAAETFDPIPPA